MKRLLLLLVAGMLAVAPLTARAQGGHEYAPIEEREVRIPDWTLARLDGGDAVNLRSWAKGKKLVLVVYYAPWCGNWHYEAPVVARLYEKYHDKGFDVVAVNNYGSIADAKAFFAKEKNPGYTVVVESEARDAREKTAHYALRTECGDERTWGSPFNVFLDPSALEPAGDAVATRAWVVGGELVEEEAEAFIRARLGLS
jgi:thiol-disulfide isomerase/thioredoxin